MGDKVIGGVFLVIVFIIALGKFINYLTSEFAVTNKRVILKVGFIRRKSLEILLDKVEGIKVNQGIIARIFNYGLVIISGTGGSINPYKYIANPLEFRKKVQEQININSE